MECLSAIPLRTFVEFHLIFLDKISILVLTNGTAILSQIFSLEKNHKPSCNTLKKEI